MFEDLSAAGFTPGSAENLLKPESSVLSSQNQRFSGLYVPPVGDNTSFDFTLNQFSSRKFWSVITRAAVEPRQMRPPAPGR